MTGLALEQMSEDRRAALKLLAATGERGTAAMASGPMHGGHLAAFVYYGLAERWRETDRIGTQFRYRVTPAGAAELDKLKPRAVLPRGKTATMNNKDHAQDPRNLFPTWPWASRAGGEIIRRLDPSAETAWECACGFGSMVHGLRDYFPVVQASDAFQYDGNRVFDFIKGAEADAPFGAVDWIVTNPPFSEPETFIRLGWRRARRGVAMLLRLNCMAGQERDRLFYEEGLAWTAVAPFAERVPLLMGRLDPSGSTAADYAWFFFQKHLRAPPAEPRVLRIRPGTAKRLSRDSDADFFMQEAA